MTEQEAVRQAFSLAMRTLRQRAGLSQQQLAEEGLTRSHVSDLERGRRDPRLSTLMLVARILKVPLTMLTAEMERNFKRLLTEKLESPYQIPIEEELRRLRDFMDQSPEMKWLGSPHQKTLYCNPPMLRFLGVAHLKGQAWKELIHPDDAPKYIAEFSQSNVQRQAHLSRYRMRGAAGQYKYFVEHAVPQFTPKGVFIGFLGTMIQEPEESR